MNKVARRHPSALCLLLTLPALIAPLSLPAQQAGVQASVEREIIRRQQVSGEFATEAIRNGATAFETRDYESAFAYYKSAVDALPDSPMTADQRAVALEGFKEASLKLSEQRISEGRFEDAETILVLILEERYAPDFGAAKGLLAKVREPDYFNKTLTPQFIGKIEEVKQLLRQAEGYYQSGQFDRSFNTYEKVLNLDPYNVAAARGKERVNNARQRYAETAYNEARGEAMMEVTREWELPIRKFGGTDSTIIEQPVISARGTDSLNRKLDEIRIPRLDLREATVREAIDFIRQRSVSLDDTGIEPRGVNIVLKLDPLSAAADGTTRITLALNDVPLRVALTYIAEAANLKLKVDPHAVLIVPVSEPTDILVTKEYKVPPGFINTVPTGGSAAPASPFGAPAGAPTAERSGARQFLEQNGVNFPQGASANFLPNSSKLIVRNTQENLDLIDQLLATEGFETPKQIEIESRFVEITQNNLQELGVDWLLGQFALPFGTGAYGGGGTLGNQGTFNANNYPIQDPAGNPIGINPINNSGQITGGNRSGSTAIQANAVDGLLFATPLGAAPGILSLAGVFTNPQFQVVLRALDQKKGVDLMSAPKVTTRSGQTARIELIREFIYPTEFDPPQIPQNTNSGQITPVTPSTPSSFDTRNLGVELEVQPQIGPDGFTIDLILQPRVTEFEGFINYGSAINTFVPFISPANPLGFATTNVTLTENVINQPIFSVREITTEVSIYDGQTVALGGLLREDIQKTEDKTPIIGDIPLIGRAFRTDASQHIKRNLVIFTTVRLVDPAGQPLIQAVEDDTIVAEPSAIDLNNEAIPGDALSIP